MLLGMDELKPSYPTLCVWVLQCRPWAAASCIAGVSCWSGTSVWKVGENGGLLQGSSETQTVACTVSREEMKRENGLLTLKSQYK